MPNKLAGKRGLFFFVTICLGIGALGGFATQSSLTTWYAGLVKPPLNPPNEIFGPVWTALYILMAIAGWRIWRVQSVQRGNLRRLFVLQLFLNGIWSFLFFGLKNPLIALADILLLWTCLWMLIKQVWQSDKVAGYLLAPYLLWVSFATYLNFALYWLNR